MSMQIVTYVISRAGAIMAPKELMQYNVIDPILVMISKTCLKGDEM